MKNYKLLDSVCAQIDEFKKVNRRPLTKSEVAYILKNSKLSFVDKISAKYSITELASGFTLAELKEVFPNEEEKLSQEQRDMLSSNFDYAFIRITSGLLFLCECDESVGPVRLKTEAQAVVPQVIELCDFMEKRGIAYERPNDYLWYWGSFAEDKKDDVNRGLK